MTTRVLSHQVLDVLTATAADLQEKLSNGVLTSEELVIEYLNQIEKHNNHGLQLNAVISLAPIDQLQARAKRLDWERAVGKVRGSLHGTPLLIKDKIMTESSLGMDTTCGSLALKGVKVKKYAAVVDLYLEAGMIILGKANLSEWAGKKGSSIPGGWSAVGGQTQTAYVVGGFAKGDKMLGHSNCCGSSSGSAVGVAAGFCPVAIGTETDGSICQPAGRSSLYAMKVTIGSVDIDGTSPYSSFSDSIGALAKNPQDLASMLGVMLQKDFSSSLVTSWEGQNVAFIDQKGWRLDPAVCEHIQEVVDKQHADLEAAATLIEASGGKVVRNVQLPKWSELDIEGKEGLEAIWDHDFCYNIEDFLKGYIEPPVSSVANIVQYNSAHKDLELPAEFPNGQSQLEDALGDTLSDEQYEKAKKQIRGTAKTGGFDKIFIENDVDLVVSLLDCRVGSMSAAAGYLHATVPLGYADNCNGRAYGLTIVAGAGKEDKALEFMSAWEASHPGLRKPPPQLVAWEEKEVSL